MRRALTIIVVGIILLLSFYGSFAQENKSQLVTRFDIIRNEIAVGGNTRSRIANAYQELSDGTLGVFPVNTTGTDTYIGSLIGLDAYSGRIVFVTFANSNTGAATLNINTIGASDIRKDVAGTWTPLAANDILVGKLYRLYNDGTRWQIDLSSAASGTYSGDSPTTVTVGGLLSGSAIFGDSYDDILEAILVPYVNPVFTSFSVTGQSTTVEVGTTLSGSKTFTWGITLNSGTVATIDLYDITAVSTLLAGTANDGTQSQTITTIQLNSNGASQQWRGIGNDSGGGPPTFNSSTFSVTGRFYRFFGPGNEPTNSAEVRAFPSAFHTGASTFTFETGNSLTSFVVALPPSVTISSVIDLDALGADITSEFILEGTVNVLDAGGTNRSYNIYVMTTGTPYSPSHTFQVTTNN